MSWTHVHIGAGKFGLGMVVDLCRRAGFRTIVLNRTNLNDHHPMLRDRRSYRIEYFDLPQESTNVTIGLHYYSADREENAVAFLASPSVVLLTTAITPDAFAAVAPLLADGIEQRKKLAAGPLCIMACENLPRNSQALSSHVERLLSPETVATYFRTNVFFCNTVVDRVCSGIVSDSDGVRVDAEWFHDWIVEAPSVELEAIRMLEDADLVTLAMTPAVLQAYETRKYWCLNGAHVAAAAYAYNYDPELILVSVALKNNDIRSKVEALQDELGLALRRYVEHIGVADLFPEDEIIKYNNRVLQRFCANPKDEISRILKHVDDIDETIETFTTSVWKTLLQEGLDSALRKNLVGVLKISDVRHLLSRVVERIIEPQQELLHANRAMERLDLDDALQVIVLSMEHYARHAYAHTLRSVMQSRTTQ